MTIYNVVSSNKRKTYFIMFLFILFFVTVSYVFGKALGYELSFAGLVLIFSSVSALLSFYFSDKIVLSIAGATLAQKENYRDLYNVVENLSISYGLPMPKVYVIEDSAPNAFATGRDPKHATIAVTTGLLDKLRKIELEGVMAHELSHIKNYDTRLMGVVAVLVGSIAILSDLFLRHIWRAKLGDRERKNSAIFLLIGIVLALISPLIASLIQLAISRRREYLADADSALLTRYPVGLADALQKIADDKEVIKNATAGTAQFYIEDPFKEGKKGNWLSNLFNTHPPMEDRIKILREM